MEKNTNNKEKQQVSKANAHDVETQDTVFATEFQSPPPLPFIADIEHVKDKKKDSLKEQKEESGSVEEQVEENNQSENPSFEANSESTDSTANDNSVQQAQQNGKPEEKEKEEELKESETNKLVFADANPEPPGDEGGDDENGGNGDAGQGGDGNPVQRKEGNSQITGGSSQSSIPDEVRSKMEASFGADFSNVQIKANSSDATNMGALAYTQGNSISFAPGQYNPESQKGQELLGHELAHVVQQRQGRVMPNTSVNGMPVNNSTALETEADVLGNKAASSPIPTQQKKDYRKASQASHQAIQRKVLQLFAVIQMNSEERAKVRDLIARGWTNENVLTNEIFYDRHPDKRGMRLIHPSTDPEEQALVREWVNIRDTIVRPELNPSNTNPDQNPDNGESGSGTPGNGGGDDGQDDSPENESPENENPENSPPGGGSPENGSPGNSGPGPNIPNHGNPTPGANEQEIDWVTTGGNIARTIFEAGRLLPPVSVGPFVIPLAPISGLIANSINAYQDYVSASKTGDDFLVVLTFGRNAINTVNGVVSDVKYTIQLIQNVATASGVGAELDVVTAPIIAFCSGFNAVGSMGVVFTDLLTATYAEMQVNKIAGSATSASTAAAYQSVADGYYMNAVADTIGLFFDIMDTISLGFFNGELWDKIFRVSKTTKPFMEAALTLVGKCNDIFIGVWGGDPGVSYENPAQNKLSEEEDPIQGFDLENASRDVAAEYLLQQLMLAKAGIDATGDGMEMFADIVEYAMDRANTAASNLLDGRDPFTVVRDMALAELDNIDENISALIRARVVATQVNSLSESALDMLDNLESDIDGIELPELDLSVDADLGDNMFADAAEDLIESGSERLNEGVEFIRNQLQELLDSAKAAAKEGIKEVREKIEFIKEWAELFQDKIDEQIVFLQGMLTQVRDRLAECNSFEDLVNMFLEKISNLLGLEETISVDSLIADWHNMRDLIDSTYIEMENWIEENVRGEASQGKFINEPVQYSLDHNEISSSIDSSLDSTDGNNIVQKMDPSFGNSQKNSDKKPTSSPIYQAKENAIQMNEGDDDENIETIPDSAIVTSGSTTITEDNQTYDITGSHREISNQLEQEGGQAGGGGDASITSTPSYYYDPINRTSARVVITVTIVKRMPNWTNLPEYRRQAQEHTDPEHRRYYRQAVADWDQFYADLEEHENAHNTIDRSHFENMHRNLIGMNLTDSDAEVVNIVQAADNENNQYHTDHGESESLSYVQQPGEGRIQNSDSTAPESAEPNSSENNIPVSQEKRENGNTNSDHNPVEATNVIQKMESAFGTSFSDVNIHENSQSAKENGALAYAQGSDIHFAPGQFKPDTQAGQELIGHELTHVVQQRRGRVKPTTQMKGMNVNADPELEKEADDMGRKAAQGFSLGSNDSSLSSDNGTSQHKLESSTTTNSSNQSSPIQMRRRRGQRLPNPSAELLALRNLKVPDFITRLQSPGWETGLSDDEVNEVEAIERLLTEEAQEACVDMRILMFDTVAFGNREIKRNFRTYVRGFHDYYFKEEGDVIKVPGLIRALEIGEAIWKLIAAFPDYVLKGALTGTIFNALDVGGYIDQLCNYYLRTRPIFQSDRDFEGFYELVATDSKDPMTYHTGEMKKQVRSYHKFTGATLDNVLANYGDKSKTKPLTLYLHSGVDAGGAFVRDPNNDAATGNPNTLTLLVEGARRLSELEGKVRRLARMYGMNGKIAQAIIAGHGNATFMELTGDIRQNDDGSIGQTNDTEWGGSRMDLSNESRRGRQFLDTLISNMESPTAAEALNGPTGRILFNACLTNSHDVDDAIQNRDIEGTAAAVNQYIQDHPNLVEYTRRRAGELGRNNMEVMGANASTQEGLTLMNAGGQLDYSAASYTADDESVLGTKLEYVEKGREVTGLKRAVLEEYARDKAACIGAMDRRIAANGTSGFEILVIAAYKIIKADLADDLYKISWLFQFFENMTKNGDEGLALEKKATASRLDSVWRAFFGDTVMHKSYRAFNRAPTLNFYSVKLVFGQAWAVMRASKISWFTRMINANDCKFNETYLDTGFITTKNLDTAIYNGGGPESGKINLALIILKNDNSNADAITFLQGKLNASNDFPAALNIPTKIAGYWTQDEVYTLVRPAAPAPAAPAPAAPAPSPKLETVQPKLTNSENDKTDTHALIPDNVNIHTNSDQATEMGALAFAKGTDIHFAPGQFKPDTRSGQELIGHELGHIKQQSEGRVQPTTQAKGMDINNDPKLEKEADDFGVKYADSLKATNMPIQNKKEGQFTLNQASESVEVNQFKAQPFKLIGDHPTIQRKEDPVQFKLDPIQMWPDISLPSWDDVTDAAGDAWDATGGRVVDAVSDGIDWAAEKLDDAWDYTKEKALETALRALSGAKAIIDFLATLNLAIAKKAIDILGRINYGALIDILAMFPGYQLIDYVIGVVAEIIESPQDIVNILARVSKTIAEKVLNAIASIDIEKIISFIIDLPGHIFAAYCFLLLNTARMARVLFAITTSAAAAIIKKIVEAKKFVTNIIRAILMGTVEFMKNLLVHLGIAIIKILIEGYQLFLQIVKLVIDFIWPVGYGINLEGGIGATFGIPLHIGVDYISYIQHKSTPIMYFFRQGIVKGGLDTGVGAGAFVGSGRKKGGSGDQAGQEWGLGAEAGANVEAGLQAKLIQEFDFPIYEDVAFISFILAATGNDITGVSGLATKLVDQIPGVNLDPMRYNTKTKMEFGVYGGASAEAQAGLRLGGSQSGPNNGSTGTNKPWESSERGNTNQRVDAPWYSPMNLLNKLNVGANAAINLSAGVGVELRQSKFGEDADGNRVPKEVELDLYGEGTVAANINAALPVPLPLNGLGIDATVGVKGTWAFEKTGPGFTEFNFRFLSSAPYFNTGDMDVFNANASETELVSTGSAFDFEEFIAGITSLKHKQRIGLASSFGRKFMGSTRRQGAVKSLLGKDYKHTGANFAGFLTYGFEISKANLQSIMRILFEFYNNHITDGNWQNMLIDFIRFFKTGQVPSYMINVVADVVEKIKVTELKIRLQAGIGIAAGAQASKGLKVRLDGRFAAGIFRESDLLSELGDGVLTREEIRDLLLNGAAYLGLSEAETSAGDQTAEQQTPEETPTTTPSPVSDQAPSSENPSVSASELSSETQQGSSSENTPTPTQVPAEVENTSAQGDSIQGNIFGDSENGVRFDETALEEEFMHSTFQGADSLSLRLAMMALYSNPRSGFVYETALSTIAAERGLTFQQAEAQYNRAIDLRIRGERVYQENMRRHHPGEDHSNDVAAPNLNIVQHPLFTASNGQLRFGKILGDVFGLDAVFGSLISPTGGLVGPANSNPLLTSLDPDNPVSIHGTAHDAAGYLYNAHNIGPGYDYLDREEGEERHNPLSGQTNINWWNEAYERQGHDVPWSARFLGRGSHALNPFVEGEAQSEKGYDHDPAAEEALRELAPTHMLYELAAHDIAYKPNRGQVPAATLEAMSNNGYMTDSEAGMKFFQGPMGFRAVLIFPKPGSGKLPLLAIRGTNPGSSRSDLETVVTDLDEAAVGHQQFMQNAVLIQAILQSAGGRVDVTGHSLGGAMAQHTAVNYSSMVASVTTFQSPGIDQESVDRFNNIPEELRPVVTHHIVTGDVVDKAGDASLAGDVYEHDFGLFLNLYQLIQDIQTHMGRVKNHADALLDIDFRNPGQNVTDYENLKTSFNAFKAFLGEVGSNVGAAHSTRVFSANNYADIRQRHGVGDGAFADGEADSGNMAGEDARLGRFSGHPHQDERRLAEAIRSTLGPELQRLFNLVFRAMEAYESFKRRGNELVEGAQETWNDITTGISDAAESIRNSLPF